MLSLAMQTHTHTFFQGHSDASQNNFDADVVMMLEYLIDIFVEFGGRLFNPQVPNHRQHCPKTLILPTVTYFGKYITKLHLKFLGGQRSRRYVCIIYDTLGIKCSQARVN